MNAYNFFFRDQRWILLGERASSLDTNLNGYTVKTKRAHRKVHGKTTLSEMAKFVAKKWRRLGQADLNYYRDLAKQDSERYKRDVKVYMSITDSFRLHQSGQAQKQPPNPLNALEDTALAATATHPLKATKLAPVPADTVLKRMDSIMVDRVLHNVSVPQFFNLFVKSDANHPDKLPINPDAFMLKWFAENQKYNVKLGEWKTLEADHKRKWCGESYRHYRVRNSIREQFELCNYL